MTTRPSLFLYAFLLSLTACGSSTPSAPTPQPIPAARVMQTGSNQWVSCLPIVNTCTFQAEIKNIGIGCAGNIRGTTRFGDATGATLGTFNWTTGGGLMRPQETYVYAIPGVPFAIAYGQGTTFTTQPAWDNVRCE